MRTRCVAYGLSVALLAATVGCGSSGHHEQQQPQPEPEPQPEPTPTAIERQAAEWRAATEKAAKVAADMTRDELLQLVVGKSRDKADKHFSAGHIPAITVSKTGFVIPAQYLCDGPSGVGNSNKNVTQFPTAISVAASFDVELARAFGEALGNEWFEKGCTHGLGPGINIIRLPQAGRSAEYYSEDPYLASRIAVSEVAGIQGQHVVATLKHFAANSQETERSGGNSSMSERTLREIYLPAFEAAVREGGAGALMCSYNRLNGTYACENDHLQNGIARDGWSFGGLIMSDWAANHGNTPVSAPRYALAGLDLDMPGTSNPLNFSAANLVNLGDDHLRVMGTRILAALFKVGVLRDDGTSLAADVSDATKVVSTDAHRQLAQQIAAAGTVLLKNVDGVLPLDRTDAGLRIAVIGGAAGADRQTTLGGSGNIKASEEPVSPLAGIQALGIAGTVTYARGAPGGAGTLGAFPVHSVSGATTNDGFTLTLTTTDGRTMYADAAQGAFGVMSTLGRLPKQSCWPYSASYLLCGGGSAFLDGNQVSLTSGALTWKASYKGFLTVPADGTYQFDLASIGDSSLLVDGVRVAQVHSTVLGETSDGRIALTAGEHPVEVTLDTADLEWFAGVTPLVTVQYDAGANLIEEAVAAAAEADVAIVVVSDSETERADHSAYLPGAQNELVERVAAVAKRTVVVLNAGSGLVLPWADKVDAIVDVWYGGQRIGNATAAVLFGDVNPSGRAVVTFPASMSQWYAREASQFPGVRAHAGDDFHTVSYDEGVFTGYRWFDQEQLSPLFPFGHGLSYTTFAYSGLSLSAASGPAGEPVTVTVTITNTGARDGAEVAQLYVGFPAWAGEPPRQLRGFQKLTLAAGASADASFTLEPRAFQHWDDSRGGWVTPVGDFTIYVGSSSRDIRAVGTYTIRP